MTDWKKVFEDVQPVLIDIQERRRSVEALDEWFRAFDPKEARLAATVTCLARWWMTAERGLNRGARWDLCGGCAGHHLYYWLCPGMGAHNSSCTSDPCPITSCWEWMKGEDHHSHRFVTALPSMYDDMLREAKEIRVPEEALPPRLECMKPKTGVKQ